jgi:fatty acid desaturase
MEKKSMGIAIAVFLIIIAAILVILYFLKVFIILTFIFGLLLFALIIIGVVILILIFIFATPYYILKKKPTVEEFGEYSLEQIKEENDEGG